MENMLLELVQLLPWTTIGSAVAGVAIWRLAISLYRNYTTRRAVLHRRKWRSATRVLRKLQDMGPGQQFKYLRQIDPFTFEEVVLAAFKLQGHKIKRNARYTGDGGADGHVKIEGQWHLVQAKRYSGAINPTHVQNFEALCHQHGKPGLFVHTGRTGASSKREPCSDIRIISGQKLLNLMELKDGHKAAV